MVTNAHLFDSEVKTEDHLSVQKIITVLVKYGHKVEETLKEMRKLLAGPSIIETSQPQPQVAAAPWPHGKAKYLLVDLRSRL